MSITSSSIVLDWINNDLKFKPKVTDIQTEFKNGYRFGEILFNLKLISNKEFNRFKNSTKLEDIKKNFILLKNHLNSILSLEIRLEEFDNIINNDKYKSTLIIYKIKNSYYKYKINFNNIQISLFPPTEEEIEEKIRNIMDEESDNEKEEKSGESMVGGSLKKENSCRVIMPSNINKDFKLLTKKIKIKPPNLNINKHLNISKFNDQNNYSKKTVLPLIQNRNKRYDSAIRIGLNKMNNKTDNIRTLNKNKSQFNINVYSSLSFDGNFTIDKNILKNNLIHYGLSSDNINNNNSINELFNKKNFQNLQNIINSRINPINKQKIVYKKISNSVFDIPEINFIRKDKKFLDNITNTLNNKKNVFSFLENNFKLFNRSENSKYKTSSKRKEYSKIREEVVNNEKNEKRLFFYHKLFNMHQQKETLNQKIMFKSICSSQGNNSNNKEDEKFDKMKYYKDINKLKYEDYNEYVINRFNVFGKHFTYMKKIILLIIDMTMEAFFYQKNNKVDFLDMKIYIKLIKLFLRNKKMRRPLIDNEYNQIKEVGKLEEKIDINQISLSNDEKFMIKDYLYYIGFWNKDKIIDNDLVGKKLDYKLILTEKVQNLNRFEEYEPTENENEDLTLPSNNIINYNYGDLILEIIENKYSNKKDANIEKNISKWNYIPYKICLIGYPFSGKKYISEKLINKYPNLKIYSVQKILRDYYSQYKIIAEPIENTPKFKSMKQNQIEQLKQEKKKQLDEFEPTLKLIKPYIDLIENKDNNKNDILVPQDELLLNILINKIEKDFPKKDKKELENEINENKKKINNILNQIETIKNKKEKKDKKDKNIKSNQKDKDEAAILNLENDIINIKLQSIKGFILVDFPTNYNQCYLLENYLTGYIDEVQKPKSLKNKDIQKLNNIIDIKYQPNEIKTLKKGGIDFIINIKLKEEDVNNRFNNVKYDPVEDKIYSELEYEEIVNNKKVAERIINEIPYYSKDLFNYYKQEYEDNISQINAFYNKFGFIYNENMYTNNNISASLLNTENEPSNKIMNVYQSITPDRLIQNQNTINPNNINKQENHNHKEQTENKKKKKFSKKLSLKPKKEKQNKLDIKKDNKKEINKGTNNLSSKEKDILFTKSVTEFISDKIRILYDELNKGEKITKEPNKPENEEPNRVEIRKAKTKKQTALMIEKDKIMLNIKLKSENMIIEIESLDRYYNENISVFIYLINKQRFDIHKRLNLIQRKFRDFLNRETHKKKVIHTYVSKYNHFFKSNPDLFENEKVKNEFLFDIEDINISLWTILNNKKNESIIELQDIKKCGFIEIELCKFFNNVKELFLVEAHKFLSLVNIVVDFYLKNYLDEKINFIKNNNNNNSNASNNNINQLLSLRNKISEYLRNNKNKEDIIFNDLISISETLHKEQQKLNNHSNEYDNDNNNNDDLNNDKNNNDIVKDNNNKYNAFSDNIISLLLKNTNILFFNSIKLLLNQNEKIEPFLQILTDINNLINKKPKAKSKKSQVLVNETLSSNSSVVNIINLIQKDGVLLSEENIKTIIKNEKNKYKYRLCFIKSFTTKFIMIISQISQNIFQNTDEWIIKSVNMENEAQNEIMNILKNKLEKKELIDEKNEINLIEMDCFEKIIDEDDKSSNKSVDIKMRPIDNSSVINSNIIYNKINIDFIINDNFFDIKFEHLAKKDEKNEKEQNTINNIDDDIKQYIVILPKNASNCISRELSERSLMSNEEEIIKEEEYYYDINKFNQIYKELLKYEIDKNIISYDNFFEVFIKGYIINNNEQTKKLKIENNNYEVNTNNEENNINIIEYNAISDALKKLNYKQVKKLISFYQINIEKNNEDKDNEYDDYIKLNEVFTILALIGNNILTNEKEEEIMNYFKDKLIHGKLLDKNEFMKYNFWFEKSFEYQKEANIKPKDDERYEIDERDEKEENISIKDFIFDLWKDESGNNMYFKKFIEVLKISNYITDFTEYSNKKYYEIIFHDK